MGYSPQTALNSPDEAESWVDARVAEGADYIKIVLEDPTTMGSAALDAPRLTAVVVAAHSRGLITVAHVTRLAASRLALQSGVDVLTHVPLDAPLDSDSAERMRTEGRAAIPTLVMMLAVTKISGRKPVRMAVIDYRNARDSVTTLHRAGVPIIAGTDANASPKAPAQIPHAKRCIKNSSCWSRLG